MVERADVFCWFNLSQCQVGLAAPIFVIVATTLVRADVADLRLIATKSEAASSRAGVRTTIERDAECKDASAQSRPFALIVPITISRPNKAIMHQDGSRWR
jgi:hypothetical protein